MVDPSRGLISSKRRRAFKAESTISCSLPLMPPRRTTQALAINGTSAEAPVSAVTHPTKQPWTRGSGKFLKTLQNNNALADRQNVNRARDGSDSAILPPGFLVPDKTPAFAEREGIAFIGNYNHPPNIEAVEFFAQQVMPLLRRELPGAAFHVYGTSAPASFEALARNDVIIEGYVEHLSDVFGSHRTFVAPLLSGAGIKGKVLSAMSYGAASVLSPIAAEGIPLLPGTHCLIATTPAGWVEAVTRLYEDESAWM
jgi:hypothetical protein